MAVISEPEFTKKFGLLALSKTAKVCKAAALTSLFFPSSIYCL